MDYIESLALLEDLKKQLMLEKNETVKNSLKKQLEALSYKIYSYEEKAGI